MLFEINGNSRYLRVAWLGIPARFFDRKEQRYLTPTEAHRVEKRLGILLEEPDVGSAPSSDYPRPR
jgi:hypothetical protein